MKPPESIETERSFLRRPRPEDANAMFTSWAQDLDVTCYLTWRPHQNIEESHMIIRRCLKLWEENERFPYIIVAKDNGNAVGMIDPRIEGHKVGIGYVLARAQWGRGYMTECTRVIIDWAFQQKGIHRVYATTDVDNIGSQHVLEKAGMIREGLLRRYMMHPNISDEPRDCYMYAVVK